MTTDWDARLAAGSGERSWPEHIAALGAQLLRGAELVVAGAACELVEIELYYAGEGHQDPFAHAHEAQAVPARWYVHRIGASYRGGTYKGLDITFGPPGGRGGILIRSLRTPAGRLISGCSLCVDYLIDATGSGDLGALGAALERGSVSSPGPVVLRALEPAQPAQSVEPPPILTTARVGLTLKRLARHPTMPAFLFAPYRFVTAPREIPKGRVYDVLALHRSGHTGAQIVARCGAKASTVTRYVEAYEVGRSGAQTVEAFGGRALSSTLLCTLFGVLQRAQP